MAGPLAQRPFRQRGASSRVHERDPEHDEAGANGSGWEAEHGAWEGGGWV